MSLPDTDIELHTSDTENEQHSSDAGSEPHTSDSDGSDDVDIEVRLDSLRSALKTVSKPFVSGTVPLSPGASFVFYAKDNDVAGRVDMANPSEESLRRLAEACDPATFGRDQQNVLDETYRKAGKLDNANFAVKFDVERSGLIHAVWGELFEGRNEKRSVRAELYKLNVYGEASFFKPHKDTPRDKSMFGSLVITYPTRHEGGALVLRHDGQEWTVDSAKILSECTEPSIAYIAFYSDVEHEVLHVTSGFRVTVTYNLFFETRPTLIPLEQRPYSLTSPKSAFHAALEELLDDSSFMSDGGNLGFGLRHEYPLPARNHSGKPRGSGDLRPILSYLKGTDAVIRDACQALGLKVSLQVVYDNVLDAYFPLVIMCHHMCPVTTTEPNDWTPLWKSMITEEGGVFLEGAEEWDGAKPQENVSVFWVTELNAMNLVEQSYVSYGNEATLDLIYGKICLIAEVDPSDSRDVSGGSS